MRERGAQGISAACGRRGRGHRALGFDFWLLAGFGLAGFGLAGCGPGKETLTATELLHRAAFARSSAEASGYEARAAKLGFTARPDLLEALFDPDSRIRDAACAALELQPEKYLTFDLCRFIELYPPSKNAFARRMVQRHILYNRSDAESSFGACAGRPAEDPAFIDQFCDEDATGVSIMIVRGVITDEGVDAVVAAVKRSRKAKENGRIRGESCRTIEKALKEVGRA